jgi:hypothetical protein
MFRKSQFSNPVFGTPLDGSTPRDRKGYTFGQKILRRLRRYLPPSIRINDLSRGRMERKKGTWRVIPEFRSRRNEGQVGWRSGPTPTPGLPRGALYFIPASAPVFGKRRGSGRRHLLLALSLTWELRQRFPGIPVRPGFPNIQAAIAPEACNSRMHPMASRGTGCSSPDSPWRCRPPFPRR